MIEEVLIVAFVMFFVFCSASFVSSYEIVSDEYSVDSFSIASVSGESVSSEVDSRSLLTPMPGAYFESDDVYGEVKIYPEYPSVSEEDDSFSVSSGGGGGAGGELFEPECFTNDDCRNGYSCVDGECVFAYDLEILSFEESVKVGDYFDFTYLVERRMNDTALLQATFWIENYEGDVLVSQDAELFFSPFETKIDTRKMFLPEIVKRDAYVFYLSVNDSKASLVEGEDIVIRLRGDLAYIQKLINWIMIIVVSGAFIVAFGVLVAIYYRKFIALWTWFRRKSWSVWIYKLREAIWRMSNEK